MKAKQVVRDVGRVMGYSFSDVDKIAKSIPNELNITLDKATAQTITHTGASGNLTVSSTNGAVLVEGSTFDGNNVTIPGNLTVNGTQTIVNSTTLEIGDNIVVLNSAGAALSLIHI